MTAQDHRRLELFAPALPLACTRLFAPLKPPASQSPRVSFMMDKRPRVHLALGARRAWWATQVGAGWKTTDSEAWPARLHGAGGNN